MPMSIHDYYSCILVTDVSWLYLLYNLNTHTHTHTHKDTHAHKHAHMHTHTRMHTCTHTHMHTCMHAHVHTHTHTWSVGTLVHGHWCVDTMVLHRHTQVCRHCQCQCVGTLVHTLITLAESAESFPHTEILTPQNIFLYPKYHMQCQLYHANIIFKPLHACLHIRPHASNSNDNGLWQGMELLSGK